MDTAATVSRMDFRQVDVFSGTATGGNPVAVVHDGGNLSTDQMAAFANWTNLSETTFLLPPTERGRAAGADYRVRIFTPSTELPFAGHPTLGTAHAWLEAGGVPGGTDVIQECDAGLITIRRVGADDGATRLAFAGPPLLRSGPVEPEILARIVRGLGIATSDVIRSAWVDNGPGWVAVQLPDARAVLDMRPDLARLGGEGPSEDGLKVGVIGACAAGGSDADVEVRALVSDVVPFEDPVTGSLNAGLAEWLAGDVLPRRYVASQGTVLGRRGRVHVEKDDDGTVWVAGDTVTTVRGTVSLP